jgi:hypothetical protein
MTPSKKSEDEQTNHSPTSSQLDGPVAMTRATITGDAKSRANVSAFAGVSSAEGPNTVSRLVIARDRQPAREQARPRDRARSR